MRLFSTLTSFALTASFTTLAFASPSWSWQPSASADAFELSMENPSEGILYDNWPLTHWTVHFDDLANYESIVNNRQNLRYFVAKRVLETCLDLGNDSGDCYSARSFLRNTSWVEEESSGFVGAFRLATTFISVDADNWFGFDAVSAKTMGYLSTGDRELRLYKGFRSDGVLTNGGIDLGELPVVLDHSEQTITIWAAALYD